jgi:hypothetical protein
MAELNQGSGATRIADRGFRQAVIGGVVGCWVCIGWLLFIWPVNALREKHPPVPGVVAYLAFAAAAAIWTCYRAWRLGVRFDERGVTVWNYFRTRRAAWAEVSCFADGTTDGRNWALSVLLRDGRDVTATATQGRPGSPEILTAVKQAAARHQIPATLTGVAAERPRAWLDAADEARRQQAWCAIWLAVTVLALAGVVPLIWWGSTHRGNYYLASLAGGLAAAGLIGAAVTWSRRNQYLGPPPVPAEDRCGEGGWFAVPLPKKAGFAPGLIARTEPRQGGILLCYFFAPNGTAPPTPAQLGNLRPGDAVLVQRLDQPAKDWPLLGRADEWDRDAWPVPAFGRAVKKTGQSFLVIYDDDLRFVGEEITDRSELDGLPPSELLNPASAATVLTGLLSKSAKNPASAARPQPLGEDQEPRTVIPNTPGTSKRAHQVGIGPVWGLLGACGLLFIAIALGVYLTQGRLIPVTASVLGAQCHRQIDRATGKAGTECDALVVFSTASGQIITPTVPESEASAARSVSTINLRYDSTHPTSINKLDYSMPFATYVFLLVFGGILLLPVLIIVSLRARRALAKALRRPLHATVAAPLSLAAAPPSCHPPDGPPEPQHSAARNRRRVLITK